MIVGRTMRESQQYSDWIIKNRLLGYSVVSRMECVGGVHKLHPLRHGRGDKGDGIGLVVGLGGEDQSLATQVFVSTGGDVAFDGLASFWRVDAEGGVLLWVPLVGLLLVLLFHWIGSRDIGIKLLGGTGWGGRKYFQVMVAALSIPLLASYPGIRWADLQKVPFLFFLGSFVDIIPSSEFPLPTS